MNLSLGVRGGGLYIHLSKGVSDVRRTQQVEFDVARESANIGNGDGEGDAIAESPRHGAQGRASTTEVGWQESLDPQLSGVGTGERVELVRWVLLPATRMRPSGSKLAVE
jgi:hypothetical protein